MGYQKYEYTVRELALAVGKSEAGVRQDVSRGRVDLGDLVSVSVYVVVNRLMRGGVVANEGRAT